VLWVAFTISSLWTTIIMYQSPGRKYLIHYGLLFLNIVVARCSSILFSQIDTYNENNFRVNLSIMPSAYIEVFTLSLISKPNNMHLGAF